MGYKQSRSRALKVSSLAIAAALAPAIAYAQAESTAGAEDEIVVTGTSIRGVAGQGSQMVTVDRAEMIDSGLATSTDVARALPQTINLGADESRRVGSQDAAANRTATSGINLRGLSGEATLLLVNGRRLAANGTIKAIADPSVVPALALQRIEVVPDGASAIYGADAVAGVVNLMTRKPFDGAETVVRYGAGDGIDQHQIGQMFSRDWEGGGFLLAYEYNFRSNLAAKDRAFLSNDLRSRGGTDQRSNLAAPGNIVATGTNRYPLPNGSGRSLTPGQLALGAPNKFDAGLYGDILPEQKRHGTFLTVNQKVTDRLEGYYEAYYSARDFFEYVTPASSTLSVPRSNPFYVNPASPASTSPVSVEYRFLDANGRASWSGYDDSFHQVAGLKFDIGGDWQLDAYVGHNINRARARTQDLTNTIFLPLALADTNPATAFNAFGNGDPANNNPTTLSKIQGLRDSYTTNKGVDFVAKVDGPVFSIPGGQVRVAVGAEHHITKLKYRIMSSIKNANNDLLLDRLRLSERDSDAVFAEAYLPIVGEANAMPGLQELNLQVAARYEEYSDFGSTTNPKVGLTWTPIDDLKIRGSWGTSFRAPSLIDASDAVFNVFIQNFTDTQAPGSPTIRGIFMNGGDPNLKPEKADTWSLGFDLTPRFLEGFRASVTYYNIEYTDVVDLVGAATAIANPAIYGSLIERNPSLARVNSLLNSPNLESPIEPASNIVIIADGRRHNLGSINQDGLDIDLGYRFTTPIGDLSLDSNITKILNQTRSVAPGLPFTDVLNLINFPVSLRTRSSVGWRAAGFSANVFWNHVGGYTNNTPTPAVEIDAYDTFDASVGYTLQDNAPKALRGLRLGLSATNLLDSEPPVVINGASGWDSQNASPIGRMVSFEVRKAW